MGAASFVQTSFAGGRWSPFNLGRYDHPKYRTAMAECLNTIPVESGPAIRRPGTQFIATTRNGNPGRVIPFSFEDNLPYVMELTDSNIRFINGTSLLSDTSTTVTSISGSLVTLASAVTWVNGDQVYFSLDDSAAAAAAPPYLTDRVFGVSSIASDGLTFTLINASGAPTSLGSISGINFTAHHIVDVASPFTRGNWANVRPVQNELEMLLLEPSTPPQLVTAVPPDPASGATASFSIAPASFVDGPYLDPNTKGITATPSGLVGLVTLTLGTQAYDATKAYSKGDYVTSSSIVYVSLQDANLANTPASSTTFWAVGNAGDVLQPGGFQATDIGRHVRLFSEPPTYSPLTGVNYTIGQVVKFNGSYWTALKAITGSTPSAGSISPDQPGNNTTSWSVNVSAARWTWGKIVSIPTTGAVNPSTGTAFGSLTGGGGLSAAFDGVIGQTMAQSANASVIASNGDVYAGLTFGAAIAVSSIRVSPSTDQGYGKNGVTNGNLNVTINLRAKSTAPASPSDGALLGTVSFADSVTHGPVTIVSSDQVTTYANIWMELLFTGGASSKANVVGVSDISLFGSGAVAAGSLAQIQLIGDPLFYTTPIVAWRLGLYTATPDANTSKPIWPTCGCYHEGRLWLGGAVRNRFDASISNGFGSTLQFAPTAPDGTVGDANALDYTLNSSDLNELYWMMPGLQGIVAGTIGGEWLIEAPASGSISPTNIAARRITKYGCANIEPRQTGLTTVLVQRYRRKLLEYVADAFSGKYAGPNLAEFARDICTTGIAEIAYQQEVTPIVWARMTDGSLAGMTYRRTSLITSQPAELTGWHRHILGSGRLVESICTGPSADGLLDTIYMVTNDPATGVRHVEALTNLFDEENDIMHAWQLDDAVSPVAGTTSGGACVFGGLSHLEGKTVSVWAAGVDCGDFAVSGGAVTVPYAGLFTQRWITQLSAAETDFGAFSCQIDGGPIIPVVIGFTFTSRGQLLRPIAPDQTGARTGPALAKYRRVDKVALAMQNTQGISYGTRFGRLDTVPLATAGGTRLALTELFSGVVWGTVQDTSGVDGQIAWEITRPYPAAILAVGGFVQTED